MTLFGLSLVLTAAFCHATWNFFVKRLHGGPELVWLFSAVTVVLYLPVALYALLAIESPLGGREIGFIAGSAVLHMGYFLLLQTGYRHGDLSLVYPTARATGPFLSTLFAVAVLGETLTFQIAAGGLTVIAGVLCLNGGIKGRPGNVRVSVLFGLMTGLLIGSYTVWDAYAVSTLLVPPLLLDYMSSVARSVLLAPVALRRKAEVRRYWREQRLGVIIIALFNPLAYILVLYALTFTPVVYIAPAREVSVLVTVLMGSLLLNEGDLKRRLVWAAVILTGIVLLATA